MVPGFTRAQHAGGEIGVVGAVGVELSLQTYALPVVVGDAALAGRAAGQEVGCVALNAGQGGLHLHGDAALVAQPAGQRDGGCPWGRQ